MKTKMAGEKRFVIGEMSVDARLLYERIVKAAVGDTVTYEELSAVIDRNVQGAARSALNSARARAKRDDSMVFGTIMNSGIKRLDDIEIVGTSEAVMRHMRRTARKQVGTLASIRDFNALPNDVKVRHNASVSIMGALMQATSAKAVKTVEARVTMTQQPLALAKTLDAFKD